MAMKRHCDFCGNVIIDGLRGNHLGMVNGSHEIKVETGTACTLTLKISAVHDLWDGGEGKNNTQVKPDICLSCLGELLQGKNPKVKNS